MAAMPDPSAVPALPVADIVTVYGTELCVDCRRARRYLDATGTPYHWIDVAADPAKRDTLAAAGYDAIPVVVMPSGQVLVEPSDDELANVIGTAA
jgi:glutaredoxin